MVIYTRCGIFIAVFIMICLVLQSILTTNVSMVSADNMSHIPMTFVDQNVDILGEFAEAETQSELEKTRAVEVDTFLGDKHPPAQLAID